MTVLHERSPGTPPAAGGAPAGALNWEGAPAAAQTGPGLLDRVAVVLRHWKSVLAVTVLTTLVTVGIAVATPPWYAASTVMVPFTGAQTRGAVGIPGLPASVAGLLGGGASGQNQLLGVVLGSRTLADSMVKRVTPRYATEAEVRELMGKRTRVQRGTDGSVVVQVRARDPELAVRIANTYPVLVNDLMTRLTSEGALRKQEYLQTQLSTSRERLVQAEERLVAFTRRSGAPNPEAQQNRTLEAAERLQASIFDQERRVAGLRRTLVPGHPQLAAAESELAQLRSQQRRVTSGGGGPVFVPFGQGGELRLETARLTREFAQEEQVFQALTAAVAETQMDANNNLPVLTVLDAAEGAGRTDSLSYTARLGALLGLVLGVIMAFLRDATRGLLRNPRNAAFAAAWDRFRGDLGLGRRAARG